MPLRKIQFIPGEFYHIFNRGNAKQIIFYNDRDRYRFLQAMYLSNNSNSFLGISELEKNKSGYTLLEIRDILEEHKISYEPLVRICADCLMPNHFHFFLQEIQKDGIRRFMQKLGNSYGKYFAIKYERPGSLFQGRFKAVHIKNEDQFKYLLIYINILNPAELFEPNLKEKGIKDFEKIWTEIENYKWSTHQDFMNRRKSILIDKGILGNFFPTPEIYSEFAKEILLGKAENMWTTIKDIAID